MGEVNGQPMKRRNFLKAIGAGILVVPTIFNTMKSERTVTIQDDAGNIAYEGDITYYDSSVVLVFLNGKWREVARNET